jgi:hypothetical protein
VVSTKKVNVALVDGTETVNGDGLSMFIKAHGNSQYETFLIFLHLFLNFTAILGIIAWFFLGICGMIIARHFRWELAKVCCGSAVWFQV